MWNYEYTKYTTLVCTLKQLKVTSKDSSCYLILEKKFIEVTLPNYINTLQELKEMELAMIWLFEVLKGVGPIYAG